MSEGKRYKWTREKMVPVEWGPYMNYLDHLAALRRAKEEVWQELREAINGWVDADAELRRRLDPIVELTHYMKVQGEYVGPVKQAEQRLREIAKGFDARAAQIEEGAK